MASTDGLNRLLPGTPRDPESKPISPQQFVSDNKDSFPTVKDLMGMSCGMLAYEISMEPRVRKAMRDVFRNHASISTVPLKSKETELDVFHTHFEVAYINRKPVMGFLHKQPRAAGQPMPATLYLKMLDAEKAGYITLTFDLPNSEIFLDRLEPLFLHNPSSVGRTEWDDVRAKVLATTVKYLLPAFEQELRQELLRTAKDHVTI